MHIFVPFSGSMEPAFYRGDLLFLTNPRNEPYAVGDITVYKVRMYHYITSPTLCVKIFDHRYPVKIFQSSIE